MKSNLSMCCTAVVKTNRRRAVTGVVFFILWMGLWMMAVGCGGSSPYMKPVASFMQARVLVVMDTFHWERPLGAALRHQVAAPLADLPQPEPAFDLLPLVPSALNATLKRSAALLFVVLADNTSSENQRLQNIFGDYVPTGDHMLDTARLHVFSDLYARGQQAALLVAPDTSTAISWLHKQGAQLIQYFERAQRKQLIARHAPLVNDTLQRGLAKRHSFSLQLPRHFVIAKEDEDFVWFRYFNKDVDKNIFLHRAPYQDTLAFADPAGYRESITQVYLRDPEKPQLYITLQPDIPISKRKQRFATYPYAQRQAGLWMLSDRSLGGAFASYLLPVPEQNALYYLEVYLYHPGGKKRDLMRELEAMIWTFKPLSKETTAKGATKNK